MNIDYDQIPVRYYVERPADFMEKTRWTHGLIDNERKRVYTEDGECEEYDFERIFWDDYGFTVHALCKYTNEYDFSRGEYVYVWDVSIESNLMPDVSYQCDSVALEERNNEAECYEIFRIADESIDEVALQLHEELGCPDCDDEEDIEMAFFINKFLGDFFRSQQ